MDERVSTRITRAEGILSFMHVPLMLAERVYGLVSVNSSQRHAFGERELRLMSELARHASGALQNALRFEQERHIAETLQQALLAERLPRIAGLELAALYQPAAGSQVGGDFYSAWPLGDGRLALLVGDVSGKGVEAAGVTAMVRYMTEALSQHRSDPAELVDRAQRHAVPAPARRLARDAGDGGHRHRQREQPALVQRRPPAAGDRRGGRRLPRASTTPTRRAAIFAGQSFHCGVERFGPETCCSRTPTVSSRRGAARREFGEGRLREALLDAADETPDRLARSVYATARTWSDGHLTDDVAIAVVKRVPVRLLAA